MRDGRLGEQLQLFKQEMTKGEALVTDMTDIQRWDTNDSVTGYKNTSNNIESIKFRSDISCLDDWKDIGTISLDEESGTGF